MYRVLYMALVFYAIIHILCILNEVEKMAEKLYLECNSGIAGDMMVAALLDLGADREVLTQVLNSIPAEGYQIEMKRVKKGGVDCQDFNVVLDHAHENHDHDMEYLHGHEHGLTHEHSHDHEHTHSEHDHEQSYDYEHGHDHEQGVHDQEHSHDHEHSHNQEHSHEHSHEHHHHHEHRGMKEITEILNQTEMTDGARALAVKIFDILAAAEAKAHAVPVEEVHFHEVGAIDSIVDIVAVAVCMDNLGIKEVIVPKLCEGTGTVRCQHGILPVPVPAVANIVSAHHLLLQIMNIQGEFVTPTGAAIVAAVKTSEKLPETFCVEKVGIGAGKREYERPSMLRVMLIEDAESEQHDTIWKLESNIDDCSGENLGYVMDKLLEAGARDVHYHPVYMKKNRPGWQLNVICTEENVEKLEQMIFRETTTIGIRRVKMERSILKREQIEVETPYGPAKVKRCFIGDEVRNYPEYDSVIEICKKENLSYGEAYQMIQGYCR